MSMRFVTPPPTAAFLCMIRQPIDDRHSAMPWAFAAAAGESLNPTTPQVSARCTTCKCSTVHFSECSHAHVSCVCHLITCPSSQCINRCLSASNTCGLSAGRLSSGELPRLATALSVASSTGDSSQHGSVRRGSGAVRPGPDVGQVQALCSLEFPSLSSCGQLLAVFLAATCLRLK
jgi:hypothetical protein